MALALTACSNTSAPSVIKTVEVPTMPTPPGALLVAPVRPAAPAAGDTKTILEHAADFGVYVGELENQNKAWRSWATGGAK